MRQRAGKAGLIVLSLPYPWSVRGLGAMDNYTHLYIEDLRPIAEKLAVEWKAAAALRVAEQEAEAVIKRLSVPNTFSTQTSGAQSTAGGK